MSIQDSGQTVKIDVKKFVNACKRNISRVNNKLDEYITNPDEKNIHDIRTSIRRLDACYKTLPKKIRNKKQIKTFVDKSRDLFKINSQIRDFDVITNLITNNNSKHETGNGNGNNMHQTKLENRRVSKLKEAKVVAVGLRKLSVPKVDKNNISAGKLIKRYNKLISNFGRQNPTKLTIGNDGC